MKINDINPKVNESLPPHLAKFFDKDGNLKPDAQARVDSGKKKRGIKDKMTDVTPKGFGPVDEDDIVPVSDEEVTVEGTRGPKQRPFTMKFRNSEAAEAWIERHTNDAGIQINAVNQAGPSEEMRDDEVLVDEEMGPTFEYGVYSKGGSIGGTPEHLREPYAVYDNPEEAKDHAKRLRRQLSPGERKYYGMGYTVKKKKVKIAPVEEEKIVEADDGIKYLIGVQRMQDKDTAYTIMAYNPSGKGNPVHLQRMMKQDPVIARLRKEGFGGPIRTVAAWRGDLDTELAAAEAKLNSGKKWTSNVQSELTNKVKTLTRAKKITNSGKVVEAEAGISEHTYRDNRSDYQKKLMKEMDAWLDKQPHEYQKSKEGAEAFFNDTQQDHWDGIFREQQAKFIKAMSRTLGIRADRQTPVNELDANTLVNYSVKARRDALDHSRFRKRNTTPDDEKRVAKRMKGDKLAGKKLDRIYKKMDDRNA